MDYVNYNGQLLPAGTISISADSHTLRYGFGLFETMRIRNGVIQLADLHWERLFAGMQQLQIQHQFTPQQLACEVSRCLHRNRMEQHARVRLQICAGTGAFPEGIGRSPGFLIMCQLPDPATQQWNPVGLTVGVAEGLQKSNDTLANLKTTGMLIYLSAAQQARQYNWDDALLMNAGGNLIESTIANLFWIKDGDIFTPPLSEGCIAGVMRRFIIEKLGDAVTETPCTNEALSTADEVFLSNAVRRVMWIRNCGRQTYTSYKVREIYRMLDASSQ